MLHDYYEVYWRDKVNLCKKSLLEGVKIKKNMTNNKVEILAEDVLNAYNKGCKDVKTVLKNLFPKVIPQEFKPGNIVRSKSIFENYIILNSSYSEGRLVRLRDGAVIVPSNWSNFTKIAENFDDIASKMATVDPGLT
jgi:hypothetical protein